MAYSRRKRQILDPLYFLTNPSIFITFFSMELTKEEMKRYARQLVLPEIGQEGQLRLKSARILIIGTGGLGSPAALYLSAAGVGTLGVVDFDKVELSNLHRQIIHGTDDIGQPKVISAKEKIARLNPEVKVIPRETRLNSQNALEILKNYDFIIDGTDNFITRYLINDACILLGKPFVYGGIFRFEGQLSVFGLKNGPCYRCFFQEPPSSGEIPSCAEAGVLGVLPGTMGVLQANETIKMICGIGTPLKGRLLIFDALATRFREVQIPKDPHCPMCSANRTIHKLGEYTPIGCALSPSQKESPSENRIPEATVQELKQKLLDSPQKIYILDVRDQKEWEIAHIEGAVLKPLSTLKENYQDIPKDKPVYVHCKLGGRSFQAVEFLKTKGYTNCINVKGGIDAWAEEIDPPMPRY